MRERERERERERRERERDRERRDRKRSWERRKSVSLSPRRSPSKKSRYVCISYCKHCQKLDAM